jgi:hypothetical protein
MLTRTARASVVRYGKWDNSGPRPVRRGDARLTGEVEVEIDLDAILRALAALALSNHSRRARMLGGHLRARVIGLPTVEPLPDYSPAGITPPAPTTDQQED